MSTARRILAVQRAARRYDVVHVHGELAAFVCLPTIARRPAVVTLHGLHLLRRQRGWRLGLARANLRLIVRAATRTVCVADSERVDLVSAIGDPGPRVVVIRNGVDVPPESPAKARHAVRAELGVDPLAIVGLFVGSLERHKDPRSPIEAVMQLAESGVPVTLLLVGEGSLHNELASFARGHEIRLLGQRTDVTRLLAASDFFVLPSEREGLSFSLLEAMATGLPVVASENPSNAEVVGDAGLLVPFGDIEGLAAAIRGLALDQHQRAVLGERARQRVARGFRRDEMLARTRALYDIVIAASRHGSP